VNTNPCFDLCILKFKESFKADCTWLNYKFLPCFTQGKLYLKESHVYHRNAYIPKPSLKQSHVLHMDIFVLLSQDLHGWLFMQWQITGHVCDLSKVLFSKPLTSYRQQSSFQASQDQEAIKVNILQPVLTM